MQRGHIIAIISASILLIGVFAAYFIVRTEISNADVQINLTNARSATITKTGEDKELHNLSNSETIKLEKYNNYTINYLGEKDYADGSLDFWLAGEPATIDISPYYSKEKLASLLEQERASISDVINNELQPQISNYETVSSQLLNNGDWYISKIKYIGPDVSNSDSLRIIMNKQSSSWVLVYSPILLYDVITYPDIPEDVIIAVNNL